MFKYAIMQYTPQRYMRKADFETQDTMRHLLDFKAGRKYATKWAAQIVGKTLATMDLTNTVIVCIPASCEQTNKRRYKRFSADVCAMCNAINGFEEQRADRHRLFQRQACVADRRHLHHLCHRQRLYRADAGSRCRRADDTLSRQDKELSQNIKLSIQLNYEHSSNNETPH